VCCTGDRCVLSSHATHKLAQAGAGQQQLDTFNTSLWLLRDGNEALLSPSALCLHPAHTLGAGALHEET
jgi:hypothetical protein